jgi:hypothetical protein
MQIRSHGRPPPSAAGQSSLLRQGILHLRQGLRVYSSGGGACSPRPLRRRCRHQRRPPPLPLPLPWRARPAAGGVPARASCKTGSTRPPPLAARPRVPVLRPSPPSCRQSDALGPLLPPPRPPALSSCPGLLSLLLPLRPPVARRGAPVRRFSCEMAVPWSTPPMRGNGGGLRATSRGVRRRRSSRGQTRTARGLTSSPAARTREGAPQARRLQRRLRR